MLSVRQILLLFKRLPLLSVPLFVSHHSINRLAQRLQRLNLIPHGLHLVIQRVPLLAQISSFLLPRLRRESFSSILQIRQIPIRRIEQRQLRTMLLHEALLLFPSKPVTLNTDRLVLLIVRPHFKMLVERLQFSFRADDLTAQIIVATVDRSDLFVDLLHSRETVRLQKVEQRSMFFQLLGLGVARFGIAVLLHVRLQKLRAVQFGMSKFFVQLL